MRTSRCGSTHGSKEKASQSSTFSSPAEGIDDRRIFARLDREELLFLTQDEDFVEAAPGCKASIIWSRVSQAMAIDQRVEIWLNAVKEFLSKTWNEQFFELYDDGKLHPIEVIKTEP